MDFPKFSGEEDPSDWLSQIERAAFQIPYIEVEDRVIIAALNLKNHAQIWFKIFSDGVESISWRQFTRALMSRFGPNDYDNYFGELSKLQQSGSVQDYLEQFETLLSKTSGLPVDQFVAMFVSGLKESIVEVDVRNPENLVEGTILAKKFERKHLN